MNKKPRILIVDDEPRICNSIKALLHTQGYDAQTCHNGHEAISLLEKDSFDLILQDIFMEGMDGFMVLDEIKKQNIEIPVIMMTGNASTKTAVKAMRIGANDYLKKPFEPDELFSLIKSTLYQRRMEIENIAITKKLNASEKKFRNLVESSNDWIYEINSKGFYTYASPQVKDILGYKPEEILGKTIFDVLLPEEIEKVANTFNSLMKTPRVLQNFEKKCLHKDGHTVILESNGTPFFDEAGIFSGFRGVKRDITQRKKADEEKKKLSAQLRQSQKMEAIGNLAGGIAHDFNNILFPIIGHTEMLIEDIPDDNPFQGDLNAIHAGALRARELVKQILMFSRQESSELKLIKVQPIIKEALRLIRSTIPTTIDLKQDLHVDCGMIKADPTQIHQIIMNLVTNSYHAMEKTGGELKVSLKEVQLGKSDLISATIKPGVFACLIVSDNGIGMDNDLTDKIFDPYFTTKKDGLGTGMGLSIIHGIIRSLGGAIHVQSNIGKGTIFYVYLPVAKSFIKNPDSKIKEHIPGGVEHILLVDDEEAILSMEKMMLERLGYQLTSRASSIEALKAFKDNPAKFDLVITDMAMPNMPGDMLSIELMKIRPDIPILICTGFSDTMSEEKADLLGIDGFLLKPIVMKDLSQKIRGILDTNKAEGKNSLLPIL